MNIKKGRRFCRGVFLIYAAQSLRPFFCGAPPVHCSEIKMVIVKMYKKQFAKICKMLKINNDIDF